MGKKRLEYKKNLSAIFVCMTILVIGTSSLLESMSLDYYAVTNTLMKIIPASIIMGGLGWLMGMVLDKPKRRSGINYSNMFIQQMIKNDLASNPEEKVEQ